MVSFPMGDGMEISAIRELKDGKLHTVGEIREREVHGKGWTVGQWESREVYRVAEKYCIAGWGVKSGQEIGESG